jgi:hypothetical protein
MVAVSSSEIPGRWRRSTYERRLIEVVRARKTMRSGDQVRDKMDSGSISARSGRRLIDEEGGRW